MVLELPQLPDTATGLSAGMAGLVAAAAVGVLLAGAELLHARRVLRAAPLAFGPRRRWLALAAVAPLIRTAAAAACAWGLVTLAVLPPKGKRVDEVKPNEFRHLVLVLDVSPSMQVEDAGPRGKQKRAERAADLVQSFFERVAAERYKTTVIAVYTDAKAVVLDTYDREVVRNILTELPMRHAFKAGETNIFSGLEEAAKVAKPWPPNSAALLMITDGDTVPATGMPKMPPSIGTNVVMVGVGSPTGGKSVGGHTTRQDVSTLRQVAVRLTGTYHDGNDKHLSTDLIKQIDERAGPKPGPEWGTREYALLAAGSGGATLALLPAVLTAVGTGWNPGRRPSGRNARYEVRNSKS